MRACGLCPFLLPALLAQAPASPQDLLQQARALWTGQGDREGALAKLEQAVAALTASGPPAAARRTLCEAYNLMAVVEDRSSAQRANVPQRFQSILDLDPDFVPERSITPPRLLAQFEKAREARFARLEADFQPSGGSLSLDGKALEAAPNWILPGKHQFVYARPGYRTEEAAVDLALGSLNKVALNLVRTSSTIQFLSHPTGAEVFLDGRSLGRTSGKAGPGAQESADKLGVPLGELSGYFLLQDLAPGKHLLELRLDCHQTQRFTLGENLLNPPDDHILQPVKLPAAQGLLTVTSPFKGGEAFLGDQPLGALPLQQKAVCPGSYLLSVRFPAGGFTAPVEVADGQQLRLEARPKPRLAFLGIEGEGDFPGRTGLEAQLAQLGAKLQSLAFLPRPAGESAEAFVARLRGGREAELLLSARTVNAGGATLVELRLATFDGLEEPLLVKPLDQEPLRELLALLESPLAVSEAGFEAQFLDVPGEPGPWVLRADEALRKAGLVVGRPVTHADGKAVPTVAALRAQAAAATSSSLSLTQEGRTFQVPLVQKGVQLPLTSPSISYPRAAAEFRLRIAGAQGEEAGLLRLNLAQVLLHYRKVERALEVLREAKLQATTGISQGTVAYLTGQCLTRLGGVYTTEAIQAFQQAQRSPGATLGGPDGLRVEPLAKAALAELQAP